MIDKALTFLQEQLNQFLVLRSGSPPGTELAVLSNIVDNNEKDMFNMPESKVIISLVFVEEERVIKSQDHYVRSSTGVMSHGNPELNLNLYLLFSANWPSNNYIEALKQLSGTISFFQARNVFDAEAYPTLDPSVKRLIVDLYTLPMDQQSQLWQSFGGKFLPSVFYKLRMLTINEQMATGPAGVVDHITSNL